MLISKNGIYRDVDEKNFFRYKEKGYTEVPEAQPPAKFPCTECEKEYASEAALAKHIADKHPKKE